MEIDWQAFWFYGVPTDYLLINSRYVVRSPFFERLP